MNKLNITETQKQYTNLLTAYDKATAIKFNVHCFHISMVLTHNMSKETFVEHITNAIEGLQLKDSPILNNHAVTRFKSLNTNKRLLEQFKETKPKDLTPESVKKFLNSFNIDSQELLQVACYSGGVFSKTVTEKNTKKLQEQKKKQSKKPSGKTNQDSSKVSATELDSDKVEQFIKETLKGLGHIKAKYPEHYKVFANCFELQATNKNELFNIHFNNYDKNGIKSK
jgi:hypothetical protein